MRLNPNPPPIVSEKRQRQREFLAVRLNTRLEKYLP
jgi:hypothetical protein